MAAYSTLLERLHISKEDVADFIDDNPGLRGVDISRVSRLLTAQLASVRKYRVFDSFSVTDVLQRLEGNGRTSSCKGEDIFKHSPLLGFWKAHFFDARFIPRNLINHWGLEYENSPKFDSLCSQVSADEEKNPSPHGWQGRLAHKMTVEGFAMRARQKNLTGEWLIFSKYNGLNYYLCIAAHSTSKEEDEAIHKLLTTYCLPEFPFLFDKQP